MAAEILAFPTRARMGRPLSLRLPPDLTERVEKVAQREGLTPSAVIRRALNAGLPAYERFDENLAESLANIVGMKPSA